MEYSPCPVRANGLINQMDKLVNHNKREWHVRVDMWFYRNIETGLLI